MRSLEHFQNLATDVNILVKNEQVTLLTAEEIKTFIASVYSASFESRSQAKRVTNLSYLLGVNTSAKVKKGKKIEINTAILYLQPYKTAFGNTCAMGKHCFDACLSTAGRVKMDVREFKILRARYLKTILFYVNREFFNDWLAAEISAYAAKYGDSLVVRLNGTSDLSPKLFGMLERFPNVQFYDYTKILNRSKLAEEYPNYHLTFSYDGYNDKETEEAIDLGLNVAIVVDGDQPTHFNGVKVFSMDTTDVRHLDEQKGQFGYLKLKQTLNKAYDSNFVIKANDSRLAYDH